MEITQEKINAAYAVADENTKKVLDFLFDEQKITKCSRPVTERIKTLDDAIYELGRDNALVQAYKTATFDVNWNEICDVLAYLKLRIIVAALNEGWTPEFVEGEYRWAPYFVLYTNKELEELSEEDRSDISPCHVVGRSVGYADAHGGLACAAASGASSSSNTYRGSRLALKSQELAEYAGKQFIDIYAQMMGLEILMK